MILDRINNLIKKIPWLMADFLTSLRLIASLPLIILVWQEKYWSALIVFIVFSLTDMADGYLARLKKVNLEKGVAFDSITDMIFFLPSFLILGLRFLDYQLVIWLVALEVLRGILTFLGKIFFPSIKMSTNIPGKIKAWFEAFGLIFLLLNKPGFIALSKLSFELVIFLAIAGLIFHLAVAFNQLFRQS